MSSHLVASRQQSEKIAWILTRRIGMVIVLGLAFLLSATVTIYTLFRSGDTRVPNLIGMQDADAEKAARNAGLNVKIQRRTDPDVPADKVIETRPLPNSSVKKDSSLIIVVSSGPPSARSLPADGRFGLATPKRRRGSATATGVIDVSPGTAAGNPA